MGRIYYQFIEVTDFGPYITKLILGFPKKVKKAEISAGQFSVYVETRDRSGEIIRMPLDFLHRDVTIPSVNYRDVTGAYPSDRFGNPLPEGEFVAIEMTYGPIYPGSAAIAADFSNINGHGHYTFCDYTVTLTKTIGEGTDALKGLVFDRCAGVLNPERDRFTDAVSHDEKMPLGYGYYVPDLSGGKKPLIIFLHGAGEGGDEPAIAYTGNKVTAFIAPENQAKFGGGAFVLVPQCPTMWMDDGSHMYGDSGISMYTEALKSLIDEFIGRFADVIDTDRIYVGGDSNGGFMTMRMLMSYPGFFAAAFPICEAMVDSAVTEEDIENLKNVPIWFTHAKNDPVVVPERYVVPTYKRLIKAGAKNVHFTFWDKIVDIHEGFKKPNGEPFEYVGHFAWIPMFNDDCTLDYDGKPVIVNGREVSLMEWLGLQRRG